MRHAQARMVSAEVALILHEAEAARKAAKAERNRAEEVLKQLAGKGGGR